MVKLVHQVVEVEEIEVVVVVLDLVIINQALLLLHHPLLIVGVMMVVMVLVASEEAVAVVLAVEVRIVEIIQKKVEMVDLDYNYHLLSMIQCQQ